MPEQAIDLLAHLVVQVDPPSAAAEVGKVGGVLLQQVVYEVGDAFDRLGVLLGDHAVPEIRRDEVAHVVEVRRQEGVALLGGALGHQRVRQMVEIDELVRIH